MGKSNIKTTFLRIYYKYIGIFDKSQALFWQKSRNIFQKNTKMNNFKVSIYNEENKKMNGLILKIGGN